MASVGRRMAISGVLLAIGISVGLTVPAGAASGDPLVLGQANDAGANGTSLTSTSTAPTFTITQTGAGMALRVQSPGLAARFDGNVTVNGICSGGCVQAPGFAKRTLDTTTAGYTAIAIGADGLPIIVYATGNGMKFAHCQDPACTSAGLSFPTQPSSGQQQSVAIGRDGFPLVSFLTGFSHLGTLHCSDLLCSKITTTSIDSGTQTGFFSSVTIGTDGLGLISYFDTALHKLKTAHCSNVKCSSATLSTLTDGQGNTSSSIAIGPDGMGLIAFGDNLQQLRVAHCNDLACSAANVSSPLETDVAYDLSMTIGNDGLGIIAYYDATTQHLKVAHCQDPACSTAQLSTIDSSGNVGQSPGITIGRDGLALISYTDATNEALKVAHCSNQACLSATTTTAAPAIGSTKADTAIAIGTDGLGVVSFAGAGSTDIRTLHCSNLWCLPYNQRR